MGHRGVAVMLGVAGVFAARSLSAGTPGIVLDAASAANGGTTSLSFNHTIGSGSNRYLVVAVGTNRFNSNTVTGITYNGTALSQIGTETQGGGCSTFIWALAESSLPSAGTYSVVISVTMPGVNRIFGTAMTFKNVDQGNLPTSKTSNSSTSTQNPTNSVSTSRAQYAIDVACLRGGSGTATLAMDAGQTERSNQASGLVAVGVSNEPGADVASPGTGTTTMSWTGTLSGSINGWSSDIIVLKPANTSAIRLGAFEAQASARGARLAWRTGYELDHLGFHVYREDGTGTVRITATPILGSGWLTGPDVALAAGRSYTLDDDWPVGQVARRYWLEEIDLFGQRRTHGPAVVIGPSPPASATPTTPAESDEPSATPPDEGAALPWAAPPVLAPEADHPLQRDLAGARAVKLTVSHEGWYEVAQADLVAAGLDPGVDPRRLALHVEGREIPIRVRGEEDGVLDPQDAIGFFGRGQNAPATSSRVYWLAPRLGPGRRVEPALAPPGGTTQPTWFTWTTERRPRQLYFPALKNGGGNKFFGPVVTPAGIMETLTVHDLVPTAGAVPVLEVGLQGSSFTPHAVTVLLDGRPLTVAHFDGRSNPTVRVPVPFPLPEEGQVQVSLQASEDTDLVLLDFVRLSHPRAFVAHDGLLRASAPGQARVRVRGFSPGSELLALDVTDEENVIALAPGRADESGSVELLVPGSGMRQLLVRAAQALPATPAVAANQPSRWSAPGQEAGADLVIIGPPTLLAAIGPLAELRERQGWKVALVDVEDLYDEWAFGAKQPEAIRSFAARAARTWKRPPRAFLLLGDASLDPRDFLGRGSSDLIPTGLVPTSYIETASDDWFADFDGDGAADVPVGRFPARTAAALSVMVAKAVAAPVFTSDQAARGGPLVFVSGAADDQTSFSQLSAQLRTALPAFLPATEVVATETDSAARLRALLAGGTPLVSYFGHGSETQWEGNLLSNDAVAKLEGPPAFWLSLTCLNGFFQDAYQTSLAETLLAHRPGGAFGVWASSGLTNVSGQLPVGRAFLEELARGATVGEAVARAKLATPDRDVRTTWILLGDPTWRLIEGAAPAPNATSPGPPDAGSGPDANGTDGPAPGPPAAPRTEGAAGCACATGAADAGTAALAPALLLLLAGAVIRRR